jgi:hypothetical protein
VFIFPEQKERERRPNSNRASFVISKQNSSFGSELYIYNIYGKPRFQPYEENTAHRLESESIECIRRKKIPIFWSIAGEGLHKNRSCVVGMPTMTHAVVVVVAAFSKPRGAMGAEKDICILPACRRTTLCPQHPHQLRRRRVFRRRVHWNAHGQEVERKKEEETTSDRTRTPPHLWDCPVRATERPYCAQTSPRRPCMLARNNNQPGTHIGASHTTTRWFGSGHSPRQTLSEMPHLNRNPLSNQRERENPPFELMLEL